MGRTFETLRRKDAAHKAPAPSPTPAKAAPARATAIVSSEELALEAVDVPFIEVGGSADVVATSILLPARAHVEKTATAPAATPLVSATQFLPNETTASAELSAAAELVLLNQPQSEEANQYRRVREAIFQHCKNRVLQALLLLPTGNNATAAAPIDVACAFAEHGERSVVLIDADRSGTPLASRLGLALAPGWAELLLGLPLAQVLQHSGFGRLHVIAAGNRLVGARALMRAGVVQNLLEELKKSHDLIVLRGPDPRGSAEAQALAHACHAVCFWGTKAQAEEANHLALLAAWQREGIRVLGTIVTADRASAK
jgi:Mrp family chromosome partitioning ATPase